MIHIGTNTKSTIVSKGIASDYAHNSYRGLVKIKSGGDFTSSGKKPIRFEYDGMVFEEGFRTDLLVDGRVVVELKSVETLARVHSKQLLTYIRLMNLPVGLRINFGGETLKEGLHRIVNNLSPSASPHLRVNQIAEEDSRGRPRGTRRKRNKL